MRLYYAPTSPYYRKVWALAVETGLDARIERQSVDVYAEGSDYQRVNPLGKIPALVRDDGTLFCDSVVICEYLDSLHDGDPAIPEGPGRWPVVNRAALASGIMDCALDRMFEKRNRPDAYRWPGQHARQQAKIAATLKVLEADAVSGALGATPDLGALATAAVLSYLDLRFAEDQWRRDVPALAAWYAAFRQRPSIQAITADDPS